MYKPDDKNLIVKSNYLIEASYKLNVQEQRIILLMASMILPEDENFKVYRINIKDFLDIVGIKDQSKYSELKEITKKLLEKVLIIKKEKSDLYTNWLSSAEYFNGKGCVELCFDPKLKPYFLSLKECFTSYKLENIIRLKSSYTIRMYELLKQYRKISERKFQLDKLRDILGIKKEEYKLYGDFKKKIIKVAQKEMANKTDITFDFVEIKKGRKVEALKFIIKTNNKLKKKTSTINKHGKVNKLEEIKNQKLYQKLTEYFCLSGLQAKTVLKNYTENYIEKILLYVEEKYKKGEVSNIGSYTLKALEEDFSNKVSYFDIEENQEKDQVNKQKKLKQLEDKLQEQYTQYVDNFIDEFKNTLPVNELKNIEAEVKEEVENQHGDNNYGEKLFIRLGVKSRLEKKSEVMSFEDWQVKSIGQTENVERSTLEN